MITARPQPIIDAIFYALMRVAMRRRFAGVLVRGEGHLQALEPGCSVLVCANHSNWWDGFTARLVGQLIQERAGKSGRYLMQEQQGLERYPFFRACGVFSVDKKRPSASLRYATGLLREARTQLWIFPQGALLPLAAPLELREGAAFLARMSGTQVLPLAIRYEWLAESKPTVLVEIAAPLDGHACTTPGLQAAMQKALDAPAQELLHHQTPGYTPLLRPRMSINRVFDYVVHRLRGRPAAEFRRGN